ncbi:snRNA-activating protein complex subunit 2 [Centropristis striata]|uniref:snRNA-activating protein complex subunit 2 n=1 Tax=Centropristis striata TaxID=184440 RepID=UPI0027E06DFF|nr:snRNA-activating protein complex subunit 2 [Centropristis striata]
MKPPPRTRSKPNRNLNPEPAAAPAKASRRWQRREKTCLLNALKRLNRTTRGKGTQDMDYAYLQESVPNRSVSEIESVVELLKDKVISLASLKLKNKRQDEKLKKPIEVWADMASSIAGTLESSISSAFSQMLIASSTEPRTLLNCDPPQFPGPTQGKDWPSGRTIPFRPMSRLPVKVEHPETNTASPLMALQTPASATGPAPSPLIRLANSKNPSPHQQLPATAGAPTSQSSATSTNSSSGPQTSLSSSAAIQTVPSTAPPSGASAPGPTATLSKPASECHERFGRTSKYATKDSPRIFGVKSRVDFERIYRYLTFIHHPNEECNLTPMESAIVLDLLMSLPEELPLLDCHKLSEHFIQVHQFLSTPADSETAEKMFKGLKDTLTHCPPMKVESNGDSNKTSSQQNTAETADGSEGKTLQPDEPESQSSGNKTTSGQSGDTDPKGQSGDTDPKALCPPLNPFMVPIELLKRK